MSLADDQNSIDDISVMEEVNPEPEKGRGTARIEMVVGLLLVAGVLAWALGTWWHDESNRSNYEQGTQAVANRRWDEALSRFRAASDYMDADARAAEAAKMVKQRDEQYKIAQARGQSGPAALSLQAAQAVQTIEPGYKDIDARATEAQEQVYTDSLLDKVVLRNDGSPPGLYYRGLTGWIYLQGSDRWSTVAYVTGSSHILYDVPSAGWIPPIASTTTPGTQFSIPEGSPEKAGRRLMSATLNSDHSRARFDELRLDPAGYNFYIVGDKGVWGMQYRFEGHYLEIPKGYYGGSEFAYEAIGSAITSTVVMTGVEGVVADLGQVGGKVLLAGYGPPVGNKANIEVYVAGPDGSGARVVYSTTGHLLQAVLSPDERHALVVATEQYIRMPEDKLTVTATLLDLEGGSPTMVVAQTVLEGVYFTGALPGDVSGQFSVSGMFLEKGAFKDKMLLGQLDKDVVRVKLVDVANPYMALAETSFPSIHTNDISVLEQPDGLSLILYDQDPAPRRGASQPQTARLKVIRSGGSKGEITVSNYGIPLPATQQAGGDAVEPSFFYPTIRGNNLIYGVGQRDNMQVTYSIYGVPLADIGKTSVQSMQVFNTTKALQPNYTSRANWAIGPSAMAYVDQAGTLHAHLYDSDVDVVLEKHVGEMAPLDQYDFSKSLR